MLIGPNAPWRPRELASQLGGVIWGAEMVVRLENELLLVHVLDGLCYDTGEIEGVFE